jgi:hypothetical protein
VTSGTPLQLRRARKRIAQGTMGELPAIGQDIALEDGDTLDVIHMSYRAIGSREWPLYRSRRPIRAGLVHRPLRVDMVSSIKGASDA